MIWHPGNAWKDLDPSVLDEAGVTCENGLVRVPYRRRDGSESNAKLFAPNGRSWWEKSGRPLLPFGIETLPDPSVVERWALLIAEGESDSLALRAAFAGTLPGAPVDGYCVLGLPGAGTWRSWSATLVESHLLIYVIGDGDEAGMAMMDAVVADIPWARPVFLPDGEDARSLLQKHGPRALDCFLDHADEVAKLCLAFRLAQTYEDFVALLRGQEVLL